MIILPMSTKAVYVCMRSKNSGCRAAVTQARPPYQAHVACVPRLPQRQSCSRTLLLQNPKTEQ